MVTKPKSKLIPKDLKCIINIIIHNNPKEQRTSLSLLFNLFIGHRVTSKTEVTLTEFCQQFLF